jgi:hypothetical protein
MAEFTIIPEKEAPRPRAVGSAHLARRMLEYERYVAELRPGDVGKLKPGPHETSRALILRIDRAGNRIGKPVQAWQADGAVYYRHRQD